MRKYHLEKWCSEQSSKAWRINAKELHVCWLLINLHIEVSGFKLVNCDKKQSPEEEGAMA